MAITRDPLAPSNGSPTRPASWPASSVLPESEPARPARLTRPCARALSAARDRSVTGGLEA